MQTDELDFVERLQAREEDALYEWVQRHYDDIFRLLRTLSPCREIAEDLAQDTFIAAFDGLPKFEARSSMRTWLHRIAFRIYVRWSRKQRWMAPIEMLSGMKDARFEQIEGAEILSGALLRIPAVNREAFVLYEVQGLTIEEIATISGAPAGTVKSRLHDARAKLQIILKTTFMEVPSV